MWGTKKLGIGPSYYYSSIIGEPVVCQESRYLWLEKQMGREEKEDWPLLPLTGGMVT